MMMHDIAISYSFLSESTVHLEHSEQTVALCTWKPQCTVQSWTQWQGRVNTIAQYTKRLIVQGISIFQQWLGVKNSPFCSIFRFLYEIASPRILTRQSFACPDFHSAEQFYRRSSAPTIPLDLQVWAMANCSKSIETYLTRAECWLL